MDAIGAVTAGLKAEVHLHCCHSVYKRQSDVTGDYKPILPRLKARRSTGSISSSPIPTPARSAISISCPPTWTHGNGGGRRAHRIAPIRRRDRRDRPQCAAARIAPERIALNPDCGFAPDSGEPPTIDEAFTKLQRLAQASLLLQARFAPVSDHLAEASMIPLSQIGGGGEASHAFRQSPTGPSSSPTASSSRSSAPSTPAASAPPRNISWPAGTGSRSWPGFRSSPRSSPSFPIWERRENGSGTARWWRSPTCSPPR